MASNSLLNLSEKLAAKAQSDQKMIETQTRQALEMHAQSLQQSSRDALNLIQGAMAENMRMMLDAMRQATAENRQEIETLAKAQKEQIQAILSNQAAITSAPFKQAMEEARVNAEKLKAATLRSWMYPTLIGLSLFLGLMLGTWGLMAYLSNQITQKAQQIEAQNQRITEMNQQLIKMLSLYGLTIKPSQNDPKTNFIIAPEGMQFTPLEPMKKGEFQGKSLIKISPMTKN